MSGVIWEKQLRLELALCRPVNGSVAAPKMGEIPAVLQL